jgi:LPS-assembly protein
MLCTITWKTAANGIQQPDFRKPLTTGTDTTKPVIKTENSVIVPLNVTDTSKLPKTDTSGVRTKIDTFSLKISKDTMDAPLKYSAEDSVVILVQAKKVFLYGKTKSGYYSHCATSRSRSANTNNNSCKQ